jgi:simple sugar transport system permease protein
MLKSIIKRNEFITFLTIVVLSAVIGIINPTFFSVSTLFNVLRASNVYAIMAFGLLLVVILGGVDISFVAISAVSSYSTHMLLLSLGYEGGILLYFIIAGVIGIAAGLLSGFLIAQFDLPIFDLSLAMVTLWYGFDLFFIGATANFDLPEGMVGYYGAHILQVQDPVVGQTGLHISVLYVLVVGVLVWLLLRYTTIGRGIYAIGGNREVAIRSGYNVKAITMIVFPILGLLASIAGVTQGGYQRNFNPVLFIGQHLDVLAAVILGGAAITGGRGTVIGAYLGVILVQLINRALILTGIPVEWQQFTVGVILVVFTAVPAIRARRGKRIGHTEEPEEFQEI